VTVLFTDIVRSTEIASELGDRRWRDLVRRHHEIVRRALKRYGGRELDTAGDGFFARFDRPADAIRSACQISDEVRDLGMEVRAGLHVGEAEVLEGKVGGIAVNVGARVMGAGSGGEVLVSSTVRDAVAGAGFEFADHGLHRLKGLDGEWRLFEVVAIDGVRRSLPLTPEEARSRRDFTALAPARGRRDRLVGVGLGVLVLLVLAVAFLTNAVGEDPPSTSRHAADPSLLAILPESLQSTCIRSATPPPGAAAAVDCSPDEFYSVSYARFRSTDEMQTAFDGFSVPADPTQTDCAREPSARHAYTINGVPAGEVACYTVEGTSISTTDSVIVWTDTELLVLGRAVRGDAADRTLYDWWRTETGPWDGDARPPKGDAGPDLLRGVFRSTTEDRTLLFDEGRYEDSGFAYQGEAVPFFAKPATVLIFHRQPPPTGAGNCPNYEEYQWRLRGDRLRLDLVSGGCREYGSREIDAAVWKTVP
jgi:hypothetical protein